MHFFLKALTLLLLRSFATANGQNLVPNPSFELIDSCPATQANLTGYVQLWFDPVPNGSSDYYNSCASPPPPDFSPSVPFNSLGYQNLNNGNAYAGIVTYYIVTDYREYVEVQLLDSLSNGRKYCGGFHVNNPECLSSIVYATDKIGIYFSSDSVVKPVNDWTVIPVIPQIENTTGNIIYDTLNWILVFGAMQAAGGEKFITIGNFRNDSLTLKDTIIYPRPNYCTPLILGNQAYYYIDDVFVEEMQVDTANAGMDTTICEGASVQLGIASVNGSIYSWQPSTGLSDSSIAQPLAFPTQTTTYILTVQDTSTGTICDWTSTDTVTVTVIPFTPQTAYAGADETLCKGESVTLGVAPCNGCTYQWQPFSNLNNANIAQPIATPLQTTVYILTMTDSFPPCGKTTTDVVNVFVEDCSIEIYNIFTPNGDTKNDFFFIKNLPANSSLQIFNRWGSRVYETSNYNNQWDGDDVPDGTYYYILVLPNKESYNGFVEIRR